jgi:hypothetical protein
MVVDCYRCGDFEVSREAIDDFGLPLMDRRKAALASYTIRKMQAAGRRRPTLTSDFFRSLETRTLPTPAEASDNLITWLAGQANGSPGTPIEIVTSNDRLLGEIGVIGPEDLTWVVDALRSRRLLDGTLRLEGTFGDRGEVYLTADGWERFEELKRAHISSTFAFFARKFDNADLDAVFDRCLRPAVQATGYELRTVTQRAGLVDAMIEDEIRRCRFLIADLSDDNPGAYWEAGFAEGLGKPVIYICRSKVHGAEKKTHFDTNHRHTVRWDLSTLDQTAAQLKAVIRNTLLGDAKQTD